MRQAATAGRTRRVLAITAIALLALTVAVVVNTAGRYGGALVPDVDPAERAALLDPAIRIALPEVGEPPYPTALLLSGCDGPHDNLARWSRALTEAGWAAVVVDSHDPRSLDEVQLWRLVCAGQVLTGGERAGDIAVAVARLHREPLLDADRVALIGASHGGWAALEYLSYADHGEPPAGLTRWPEPLADDPAQGLVAALLLYPYCGNLALAARRGWTTPVPILFMLAGKDTVVDAADCEALAAVQAAEGLPVRVLRYRGATHAFDQREAAMFSTSVFSPEATEDAITRGIAHLEAAIAEPPR